MDRYLLQEITQNLFFSNEAASYLGVTPQRLNQLVHSGQLTPIKKTSGGSLFWKADLDERKQDVLNIACEVSRRKGFVTMDLNLPVVREAINYFTIQSLYDFSDKKTEPVFQSIANEIDLTDEFPSIVHGVSELLRVDANRLLNAYQSVRSGFSQLSETDAILKKGTPLYPTLLSQTQEAPPFIFLRGDKNLLNERIVSVVGSRSASPHGHEKASRLSRYLGKAGIVVASGLARGIDTAAHRASLDYNYPTIAVIGTPISKVYPKENGVLQKKIGEVGLILSQYPPSSPTQRWHFPMRNAVMSGISLATVIVEAGETSGALKQADYAIKQGRLVFIPQSALDNPNISWPNKYLQRKGAEKFSRIEELLIALQRADIISSTAQAQLLLEGADLPVPDLE